MLSWDAAQTSLRSTMRMIGVARGCGRSDLLDGLRTLAGTRTIQHSLLPDDALGHVATRHAEHRRHHNSMVVQSCFRAHTPPTIHIQQIAVCSRSRNSLSTRLGGVPCRPKRKIKIHSFGTPLSWHSPDGRGFHSNLVRFGIFYRPHEPPPFVERRWVGEQLAERRKVLCFPS